MDAWELGGVPLVTLGTASVYELHGRLNEQREQYSP
jgi:hypothetical protein